MSVSSSSRPLNYFRFGTEDEEIYPTDSDDFLRQYTESTKPSEGPLKAFRITQYPMIRLEQLRSRKPAIIEKNCLAAERTPQRVPEPSLHCYGRRHRDLGVRPK